MDYILNNWHWMLCAAILIIGGAIAVYKFCKISSGARKEKVLGWLLQAVTLAEREFGSGTGRLKLSVVYDKFCERFPWLSRLVSFQKFSQLVDDALAQMRALLESNMAIAAVIDKDVSI